MKKTIVALVVAAVMSTSANAVTVYKKDGNEVELKGAFQVLMKKEKNKRLNLVEDGSYLQLSSSHAVFDNSAFFSNAKLKLARKNFSSDIRVHDLFVGFRWNDFGSVSVGVRGDEGNPLTAKGYNYGLDLDININKLAKKGNKMVRFSLEDFHGFSFDLDYVIDNAAHKEVYDADYARSLVLSTLYDLPLGDQFGLAFKVNYSSIQMNNVRYVPNYYELNYSYNYHSEHDPEGHNYYSANHNANYRDPLHPTEKYVAPVIHEKLTKTSMGLLVGAKYQVTDALKVYSNVKVEKSKQNSQTTFDVLGIGLGAGYKLNKYVETFVEGRRLSTKEVKDNVTTKHTDNKIQAGLRVSF